MSHLRWRIDGELTPLLRDLVEGLDLVLESPRATPRARMGRKRFYRVVATPGNGETAEPALLVKIFVAPGGVARLLNLVRRSRAQHEAAAAERVAERGFAVSRPVAVGEERRGGFLRRSVSIVRELPLRDLRAILRDPALTWDRRRALVISFATLVRRLHDAGVDQDDTSPNNFLVSEGPEPEWVLIDFERCTVGPPLKQRRWTLLAKLHRHGLGVTRSDRLRFLRAYLADKDDRAARREAWERIRTSFFEVRKNDARRAAKGAFQEGRHVGSTDGTWFVKGREEAAVIRLSLGPPECRAVWTLTHVFERLGLPALRPVRLAPDSVDLLAPELDEHAMEFHSAVARARRQFEPYGRFVRDPQWALTREGAILLTPTAFKLDL